MARPSTVDRLPIEARLAIKQLRAAGGTLDEIMAKLGEIGVTVSRSALGRHVKKMGDSARSASLRSSRRSAGRSTACRRTSPSRAGSLTSSELVTWRFCAGGPAAARGAEGRSEPARAAI